MAGAIELATAYIALVPSLKGASQGISSQLTPASAVAGAEGSASLGSALVGGLSKFAAPIAGIVAAFSVGKLVKDSIKDFQEYQGAVNGFGRIAGGTTKEYSGLREAIKLSGVDVDAAQGGLTIFSKNLGNASQDGAKASAMAKKLGTDFLDAHGQVKPMSDILPGLSDKFKAMPDGAEKTALAMQLFGRSGTQMLPFLNQGSEGIAKLTAQAGKMGLILDDTDKKIFAASKAGVREYAESVKGLHVAIGSTLLPVFTAFGNIGRSITIPMIQALSGAIQSARGPMMAMAGHVQAFADRTRAAMEGILTLFTKGNFTGGLGKALGIEEDSKIVDVILKVRDGVMGAFQSIKGAVSGINLKDIFADLKPVFEPVVALFQQLAPVIAPLLPQIISLATSFSPLHMIFSAIAPVLPQIASALGQLATAIGTALGTALTTVVPVLVQLSSVIIGSLGSAVQSILPALVGLIPIIAGAFTQLLPVIAGLITQLAPLVASLLPPLVGLFTSLIPVVVQLVTSVLPVAVQIITMLVQAIVPLVITLASMLIPIIQALMPVVMTVFSVIAAVITSVMQIVQGVIQVVLGIISGNWGMVWDGILNIFSGIWNTIVAVVSGVLGILGSIIFGAMGGIWDFIGSVLGNIGNFFANTWNNIISGVSGFIGNLLGFFSGLPGQIMGFLSGAGQWLYDAGKNIIEGLINGVKSMMGAIGNAILSLIPGPIVGVFKTALGIESPSKVFRGFGRNIVEGLILGTGDKTDDLTANMRDLVTVPTLPTQSAVIPGSAGAGRRGAGVTNNWTINQVDDPIGTSHAIARRQNAMAV